MKKAWVLLLALPLVAAGCSKSGDDANSATENATKPIKLGFTGGFSGPTASFGAPIADAVEYTVREINAAGGIKGRQIELVKENNEGDPFKGQQIIDKFDAEGVKLVISGSSSAVALSEKQKVEMNRMVALAVTAADPRVTDTNDPYYFTAIPNSDYLGGSIAYYAATKMGLKQAIVFTRDDAYGQSIYKSFKAVGAAHGLTVVQEYTYPVDAKDFNSYLSQGLKEYPNADIMITGYASDGGLIAKQARALGYNKPILGNVSLTNKEYSAIAGSAADNTYVTATNYYDESQPGATAQRFHNAWIKRNGKPPNDYEVRGYDSVYLLTQAVKDAGDSDPENVRKAMLKIKDFDGASGSVTFNAHGGVDKSLFVMRIAGGRSAMVQKIAPHDF